MGIVFVIQFLCSTLKKIGMGKKIKILPILCFAGVILLLCAALLFIENIYYQLSIIVFVFILANSLIYFSKRNYKGVVIYTANKFSSLNRNFFSYTILFLSIFLIPKDYFVITAIIISILFVINIWIPKWFIINNDGIRYFHWNLKWENIQSYYLDKKNGTLSISIKNTNKKRHINGIKKNDYTLISRTIDKYFNKNAYNSN